MFGLEYVSWGEFWAFTGSFFLVVDVVGVTIIYRNCQKEENNTEIARKRKSQSFYENQDEMVTVKPAFSQYPPHPTEIISGDQSVAISSADEMSDFEKAVQDIKQRELEQEHESLESAEAISISSGPPTELRGMMSIDDFIKTGAQIVSITTSSAEERTISTSGTISDYQADKNSSQPVAIDYDEDSYSSEAETSIDFIDQDPTDGFTADSDFLSSQIADEDAFSDIEQPDAPTLTSDTPQTSNVESKPKRLFSVDHELNKKISLEIGIGQGDPGTTSKKSVDLSDNPITAPISEFTDMSQYF